MTAPEPVFAADGRAVPLGRRIGSGGEGEVFAVDGRPSRAVKIYRPQLQGERGPKIAAMVSARLGEKSSLVSFPLEGVFSGRREFRGFVMKRVAAHRPVMELYIPSSRKALFPQADLAFLARTAANAARAVGSVHYAGCVVGDINQSGLLVSDQAVVAMIDADSFQIGAGPTRFLCGVGVEEYTAPELRGRDFATYPRTQNHDAFGLATLLFQLLFLGRQPFSGRPRGTDMELGQAIREHRFAYSAKRDTGFEPPPGVPTLGDLSPMLEAAFESAFAPAGSVGLRPKALQWADYLQRFEAELVGCAKRPRHRYHPRAGSCTWCRVAGESGVDPF